MQAEACFNAQCTMHNAQLRRAAAKGFGGACLLREQAKPPTRGEACRAHNRRGYGGRPESPPKKPLGALNIILAQRSEWLYLTPQPPSLQREGGVTSSGLPPFYAFGFTLTSPLISASRLPSSYFTNSRARSSMPRALAARLRSPFMTFTSRSISICRFLYSSK